jgi:hypothetical protein
MVPTNAAPSRSSASGPSRSSTRAEISAFSSYAARPVKVNTMMPAGSAPLAMSSAKRCATTSVLPEPAEVMSCG